MNRNSAIVPLVKLTNEQVECEAKVDRYFSVLEDTRDAIFLLIKTKVWESYNLKRDDYFWHRFGKTWKAVQLHQSAATKSICETKTIEQGESPAKPFTSAAPIDPEIDAILDTPAEAEARLKAAKAAEKKEEKKVEAAQEQGKLDRARHVVPSCLIDVFVNADKWADLCHELRQLGRRIASQVKVSGGEMVATDTDVVYCDHDEKGRITLTRCPKLNEMAEDIEHRMPHSICPECKGLCVVDEVNHCFYCHDRGWLIKTNWEACDNQDALEVA